MSEPRGLRIGRVPGVTTTKWERIWAERFREPLDIVDVSDDDQLAGLRDGSLDMAFLRLPIDRDGLHAIPLYEEQMVAWVSKEDSELSLLDELTMADLADERVLTEVNQLAIDYVLGGAVLLVPMSIARSVSRRDLVHRPVVDAEPSPVALVWRIDDEHPLIEEFIGVVRGRTVNSSRTERERKDSKRKPARSQNPTPKTTQQRRRTSGPKRGRR